MAAKRIKVGISMGDCNGVGPEVILKTFADQRMLAFCTPIIYGSTRVMNFHRKALGMGDVVLNEVQSADEAVNRKVNIVNITDDEIRVSFGEANETSGSLALKSLVAATEDLASNKCDVLVTAPINKKNVQSKEFPFPGQTEYLAHYSNTDKVLMLMIGEGLRVAVATGHLPLKDVAGKLSKDLILQKLDLLQQSMIRDFGIVKPRIAVLGLNPHAGDDGLLGDEEQRIIEPAIAAFQSQGNYAYGPYGSDGFFGTGQHKHFDAVLAMYHDQGLAPFKALAFESGVNFTAGLPIVRTSPDHGPAMDIAGKNEASSNSFRAAVYAACDIYNWRREYREMTANPLEARSTNEKKAR
ncbi:MAG: 4-hydroxythreonine-4-phosphate dehydrogenase PdxA [Cryomorphaceae bacterium]|nr:MAG: 4-hydroxythreonine-4-phosphate dehydrogenase PdxA [Cryomorphaceae bacterium]